MEIDYWTPLIPFKSPRFNYVDDAQYVGQIAVLLKQAEYNRNLLQKNPDAWSKEQIDALNQVDFDRDDRQIDLQYYANWNTKKDVYESLPKSLAAVSRYSDEKPVPVFFVDVVLTKWQLKQPVEVELLREAILIRGAAAYVVAALDL